MDEFIYVDEDGDRLIVWKGATTHEIVVEVDDDSFSIMFGNDTLEALAWVLLPEDIRTELEHLSGRDNEWGGSVSDVLYHYITSTKNYLEHKHWFPSDEAVTSFCLGRQLDPKNQRHRNFAVSELRTHREYLEGT